MPRSSDNDSIAAPFFVVLGVALTGILCYITGYSDGYKKGEDDSGKVREIIRHHDVPVFRTETRYVDVARCARCDPPRQGGLHIHL